MPRHPPCALCSLTTRIERSPTKPSSPRIECAVLDFGSDRPHPLCSDVRWASHTQALRFSTIFSRSSPWENASRPCLRHDPSAFFQDANYHDQIVKDRRQIRRSSRSRVTIRLRTVMTHKDQNVLVKRAQQDNHFFFGRQAAENLVLSRVRVRKNR